MSKILVGGAAALFVASAASAAFDPANWSYFEDTGVFGSGSITSSTLTIVGGNASTAGYAGFAAQAATGGTVSFDWTYTSGDTGQYDIGGYFINGVAFSLADNESQGTNVPFSFLVNAGDEFGFFVYTVDGVFGPGTLSIDRFDFTGSFVPAPGAVALLGLAGLAGRRRRA